MPRNRFSQIQAQLRQFLLLDLYCSYSQLNHLSLNMVHRETINKGITLNDVSFLFGLTQCAGPRSPAWQVCVTKVTYCKGPIQHQQGIE